MPDSRPESGPAHPGKVRATPGLRVHGHDGETRDVGRAVIRDPSAGAGAQASWRLTPAGAGAHRQLPAWQRVAGAVSAHRKVRSFVTCFLLAAGTLGGTAFVLTLTCSSAALSGRATHFPQSGSGSGLCRSHWPCV